MHGNTLNDMDKSGPAVMILIEYEYLKLLRQRKHPCAQFIMENERRLLEQTKSNTIGDWIANESFGVMSDISVALFKNYGKFEQMKHFVNGGTDSESICKIHYLDIPILDLIVRFPGVALLCVIGILIGLKGFIFFKNYSLRFSLAFIFYGGMNLSGLLLHSLIPITNPIRIVFVLGDAACTGVSGVFLCSALLNIKQKSTYSPPNSYSANWKTISMYIAFVIIAFALSTYQVLGEYVYQIGFNAVLFAGINILICGLKGNPISPYVYKMGQWTALIIIGIACAVVSPSYLCPYNSRLNIMLPVFGLTHIGFIVTYHYIAQYYSAQKTKSK
eukprot:330033_1